ncbi:hypothetical protein PGTUg99_011891 [Puccinia graminis f. sp. tritici]|uniref:Uncharacterized protein n=1 Tax=Puccinia graminis f. sp. tritici TaxID=56615 RepID=A0A5B0RDX1_PUCGR|nr:hypothetical protein PGTUg99_011891 [Puccinia graminis f. sp. tritici]
MWDQRPRDRDIAIRHRVIYAHELLESYVEDFGCSVSNSESQTPTMQCLVEFLSTNSGCHLLSLGSDSAASAEA